MSNDRFDELCRHAADLGIDVEWSDTLPPTRHGYYDDDNRLIVINRNCTAAQGLSTLAHELIHAFRRDRCSTPRVERVVDEGAARLVIEPDDYAAAEQVVGCHPGAIARELGVTERLVRAWRRQWAHRTDATPDHESWSGVA